VPYKQDPLVSTSGGCNHFNKREEAGRLIVDEGRVRYLENNLWVTLNDELRDPRSIMQDQPREEEESEGDGGGSPGVPDASHFVFGVGPLGTKDLIELYPPPQQAFYLWRMFLENVNPLCMIVHAPSFRPIVDKASEDIHKISRNHLALLCSIHTFAMTSMSDEDCRRRLGGSRIHLLKRYRSVTQHALINAGFLRSTDVTVLQAFVLFLLLMRQVFDAQTLWTLSGVAFRIAQRIGLHRDGADIGLSPFEVEMRRRLWRQMLILDHTSAELAGSSASVSVMTNLWDTKLPTNCNDSDLDPDMKEPPVDRIGATDMIFCMLRYQFGSFFRPSKPPDTML